MLAETAVVTRVEHGQIWIKSQQSGACGACMQQASCGTASVSKWLPKREFAVESDLLLQVGDQVRVEIDDSQLLLSSLLMYIVPLLLVLLGVILLNSCLPSAIADVWLPLIALAILLLAFRLLHRFQAWLLLYFCFKPQILAKSV